MLTDRIQEKLNELSTLPGVKAVGLGKKIIGGNQTDTIGITFGVKAKETNPENMLPTSIDIDGITYVTDVIEIGEIAFAACPATPSSSTTIEKYVISGMSYVSFFWFDSRGRSVDFSLLSYNGTFGFVAYHTERKMLVGVTAAHLLLDASQSSTTNKQALVNLYIADTSAAGLATFNFPYIDNVGFSNGRNGNGVNIVSQLFSYEPLKVKPESDPDRFNQVDASLSYFFSLLSDTRILPNITGTSLKFISTYNPSWRSYHVKGIPEIVDPMPFATTAELNALVSSPPSFVSSTGAGSGVKHGAECGLKIDSIGVTTSLTTATIPGVVYFDNLISFSRITPGLPTVVAADSGAALVAKISGVWKIIGLVIGGNDTVGYACRIDKIAERLGIEAWDGSVKSLGNIMDARGGISYPYIVAPEINDSKKIVKNGRTYYQNGLTKLQAIGYYE
jgi:hypothetical protein